MFIVYCLLITNGVGTESNVVDNGKNVGAYAAGRLAAARAKAKSRTTPARGQPPSVRGRAGGRGPTKNGRGRGPKPLAPLLMPAKTQPPLLTASENGSSVESGSRVVNSSKSRRKRPRGKKNRPKSSRD